MRSLEGLNLMVNHKGPTVSLHQSAMLASTKQRVHHHLAYLMVLALNTHNPLRASLNLLLLSPQFLLPGKLFQILTVMSSFVIICLRRYITWVPKELLETITSAANNDQVVLGDNLICKGLDPSEAMGHGVMVNHARNDSEMVANQSASSELSSLQQNIKNHHEEPGSSKEEFPPSPSDHQSILVSLSSRCVWKGTVCERSHLFRIKYYGSFDKPLGRFLRDHLFDQSYQCRSCEMPSEAHVHCYTHRQGTLTISVKKLPEIFLPGEREGKIWMWHRCLRCPRTNGFPPATRRVVMSDAAWGLSFGKFLELSFSNHAAASRVASCGHSLHRDCLRFYGFGKMVACFRYASIDVHSVYLPRPKLDFNYENQDWLQKETNEVVDRAELLFSEVLNALSQIAEKRSRIGPLNGAMKMPESRRQIVELEGMLQKEKTEFEESLQKTLNREVKKGQPVIDILEINRLRRQLLFQSYMWDHRLIYAAASLDNNILHDGLSSAVAEYEEEPHAINEKLIETNVPINPGNGFSTCDSLLVDASLSSKGLNLVGEIGSNLNQLDIDYEGIHMGPDSNLGKDAQANISATISSSDQSHPLESEVIVRRAVSDGQLPIMANLSESLDAAWTGENHPGSGIPKDNSSALLDSAVADSSTAVAVTERLELEDLHRRPEWTQGSPLAFTSVIHQEL
ncbi:hypothetical protein L1049_004388 [Liquidambar formosana]|uniref:Uncharacterized protein n=1 Tax=Liquidambar formosana TaxID=63359 RepID=A0AAP0X078_LIQFO